MTTTNGDSCVSLMKGTLVLPVPRYPANVVTDASLKIAANQVTTTLVGSVSSGDSIFRVSDISRLVVDMLLTLDNEIVSVSSIDSATNTISVTRGFDGTVPTGHGSGRTLAAYIDAWHHNALAAEVKAIEQTLGPNLSNITGAVSGGLISTSYIWQRPATGNLSVGTNVVTLTPVPFGVNGTDLEHYVYVSGGTGAAEACKITGGTAVSGAATGTIVITCANAHSGAWSIGTATAGIQEALLSCSGLGGSVYVPMGEHLVYSTIFFHMSNLTLQGSNAGGTRLTFKNTTLPGMKLQMINGCVLSRLQLYNSPSGASNYGIDAIDVGSALFEDITINDFAQGIRFTGYVNTQFNMCRDVFMTGVKGVGVYIDTEPEAAGRFNNITIAGTGAASSVAWQVMNGVGFYIDRSYTNNMGSGILLQANTGKHISSGVIQGLYCDGGFANVATAFRLNTTGTGKISGLHFKNCGSWNFNTGVVMDGDTANGNTGITFSEHESLSNKGIGYYLANGKDLIFEDCFAIENSLTTSGTADGMFFAGALDNVQVRGGLYAFGWKATNNSQRFGISLAPGCTRILIDGATVGPNVAGGINLESPLSPSVVINNCIGYNPGGMAVVSVGASPFTYTSGHSAETVYIAGGTVSLVKRDSYTLATSSPCIFNLSPNTAIVITYSVAPTIVRDIH